ncbi:hypothetical protein GCM10014713_63280 [Streptomyces purpureus]|uniref:L,D-transpeptidase n=1 Tax=Streptomyces purpureus TaxID=1951 RepID=A0A918HIJ2_9ACTN|nr:hypothetical protein GCM10014713_63280 [Streptomyces purpureus]
MAGLTAAAIAAVTFLAYQASATVPADLSAKPMTPAAPPAPSAGGPRKPVKDPLAIPAKSGSGQRVVYGLADRRVWLVDGANRATRAFSVMPSTVNPKPGTYAVTSRSGLVRGSDGVRVEHVVRFTTVGEVPIGFSAAVDGTLAKPDPNRRTGGVRMKRADGDALWSFATIGSKVVVVP